MNTIELARTAARRAVEIRLQAGVSRIDPLNAYDLAMNHFDIRVQFLAGGSFEGMFAKEERTILVPSERPPGRRMFAAAHEFGHWAFGHGSQIDENPPETYNQTPEERLVNQFAGHLLMFPPAVDAGASMLKLNFRSPNPKKVYELACWFGVGYATLVSHLRYGLQRISALHAEELLRVVPRSLRKEFSPRHPTQHLVVATSIKPRIPIDLAVGDHVIIPTGTNLSGTCLTMVDPNSDGIILVATSPGIAILNNSNGWAGVARVMRRGFTGWAKYRHLEDDDYDND